MSAPPKVVGTMAALRRSSDLRRSEPGRPRAHSLPTSATVIVPTFNRGHVLVDTLEQLVANDHPDFDVVVVDQTAAYAPDVESRIRHLEHAHQRLRRIRLARPSLTAARNVGLRASDGEVVIFCDDDLELGPDLVAEHVAAYADPRVGAVAGRVLGAGSTALEVAVPEVGLLARDGAFIANFHRDETRFVDFGMGCNMSFRRTALNEARGFDERFTGSAFREEGDAFARVKKLGYEVLFTERASVVHLTSPEGGCRNDAYRQRMYSTFRNETLFFLKNLRKRDIPRFAVRVARWMLATARSDKRSWWTFGYFLSAFGAGAATWAFSSPDRITGSLRGSAKPSRSRVSPLISSFSTSAPLDRGRSSLAFRLNRLARKLRAQRLRSDLAAAGVPEAAAVSTHMTSDELAKLFELAERVPVDGVVFEVGSYLGASTCYLAAGLHNRAAHLICVDTWQNETMDEGDRDTFAEFRKNTAGIAARLELIRKRSDEVEREEIPERIDLLFLDGDHSYAATKGDFELLSPSVVDGGTIAFHDAVFFQGVARTIGEALADGRWRMGGHVHNLLWLEKQTPHR